MIFILLIVAFGCSIIAWLALREKQSNYSEDFMEYIGLVEFLRNKGTLHWLYAKIKKSKARFIQISLPGQTAILFKEPEDVKIVLSDPDHYVKAPLPATKMLQRVFIPSIVSENGPQWRRYRESLGNHFHFDTVKTWIPLFNELDDIFLTEMGKHVGEKFDVVPLLTRLTIDALGRTVFHTNFDALKGNKDQTADLVTELVAGLTSPGQLLAGKIEKWIGFNFAFSTKKKCQALLDYFTAMIENRRKELKDGDQPTQSVIDVMLTADANFNESELIANIVSIFLAGFETTATSLTFFMKHLGEFTEVQQKCREEVKAVLGDRTITAEDLRLLPYVTATLKESMRYDTVVGVIPTRVVNEDVEVAGLHIKKGTMIWLSPYGLHTNPKHWPNPEKFDPERFLKTDLASKRHPFAYMPFGMKSRACIGNQFSLVEQTVFISALLQRFKWTTLECIRADFSGVSVRYYAEVHVELNNV